ncbi:hypothetical protein HD806DRAFT_522588 [Xylariaceae sp. AK1471]|nr:hypothetical protein HD806DRAFT_522588 [Xylariaceae sp. AK1471]
MPVVSRSFQPTRAVREGNARRRCQQRCIEGTSKAQVAMDWRQLALTRVPPAEVFRASETMTKGDLLLRKAAGMSLYYRGDPTVVSNQSAAIPDSKNTSLFVTGLPWECATYYDLMDLLKGRGKIFAASIAERSAAFQTAAATITFFRHVDAENVLKAINCRNLRTLAGSDDSAITVGDHKGHQPQPEWRQRNPIAPGCKEGILITLADEDNASISPFHPKSDGRLRARWNRVRVAEPQLRRENVRLHQGHLQLPSRVIHVCGPPAVVNPGSLEVFFSSKFRYDLDRTIYHGVRDDGSVEYEYRFACWKNQAEFADMALRREMPRLRYWYGIDPCEVVEDDAPILTKQNWRVEEIEEWRMEEIEEWRMEESEEWRVEELEEWN